MATNATFIVVSWKKSGIEDYVDQYHLYYHESTIARQHPSSSTRVSLVDLGYWPKSWDSFNITGLRPNSSYAIHVEAVTGSGDNRTMDAESVTGSTGIYFLTRRFRGTRPCSPCEKIW